MKRLILIACLLLTANLQAAFSCNVTVNRILLYGNGAVNVLHTGRSDYTVICNLKTEWKGVSVTTCAMWAGLLQDIKKRNGKANFYYNTTDTITSCANLPTYSSTPAPVYIGEL